MSDQPTSPRARPTGDLAHLIRRRLTRQGHAPFLTFYDDDTGERTELSYATFDNWVAKTANLIVSELDAGPGSVVALASGTHWTSAVIAFAAWRAGTAVIPVSLRPGALEAAGHLVSAGADALFVHESAPPALRDAAAPERTVVVGAGLGGRLTADAGGALGFGDEVPAFADHFEDPQAPPDRLALQSGPGSPASDSMTVADLMGLGDALAARGLSERDRVLCAGELVDALVLGCFGPFFVGASTVVVRAPDALGLDRRARDERVTLVLAGHPALDGLTAPGPGEDGQPAWRTLSGRLSDWR